MSRFGYVEADENHWEYVRWRGAVRSAIKGKRGQAFLRELADAMDNMEEKELIRNELQVQGQYCALGLVGKLREIDMSPLDPEDPWAVADCLNIAPAMVREITYMNDELGPYDCTPELRWQIVRNWVRRHLK